MKTFTLLTLGLVTTTLVACGGPDESKIAEQCAYKAMGNVRFDDVQINRRQGTNSRIFIFTANGQRCSVGVHDGKCATNCIPSK